MAKSVADGSGMIGSKELFKQIVFGTCKIKTTDGFRGTGFVGYLPKRDNMHLLITCNHVLQGNRDQLKDAQIIFHKCQLKGDELFIFHDNEDGYFKNFRKDPADTQTYGLDYTMIEVDKTKLTEVHPFDLTPTELMEKDNLIVAGYPIEDGKQDLETSIGQCIKILGFFVYYGCKTLKGSSGSPILKVVNGKLRVVAIHNGAADLSESRKYGIEFKAVLCHAGLEKGEVPKTTKLMVNTYLKKVKWKPLEFATLLRLLQPVEESWETLGRLLLEEKLKHKIDTIRKDASHKNAEALDKVLSKWRNCTPRETRTWQTLCVAAKKYGDESPEQYILQNCLNRYEEPTMYHLQKWSKNSPLCTNWYKFAVELVDKQKAGIIKYECSGGGSHECLENMLIVWHDSPSTDRSWEVITAALTEMDALHVIESIEKECLMW